MKNKTIILIIACFIIAMSIIGGTLAYYRWQSTTAQKTNVTFTIQSGFSCSGDAGGNITSADVMLAPTTCDNTNYAIKRKVTANVTNNRSDNVYLNLWLDINHIDQQLSNSNNFKYVLTTNENSCTTNIIKEGTFHNVSDTDKVYLVTENSNSKTNNKVYYLYIWLDEAESSSSTMNRSFNFSLNGSCHD